MRECIFFSEQPPQGCKKEDCAPSGLQKPSPSEQRRTNAAGCRLTLLSRRHGQRSNGAGK
uniref:Uncharacterized protein n=1 Tax=Anopheles dirus TaxID=7168 RepID=A0A182NYT2_9DIPT